jgi:hypothetical protein
LNHPPSFYRFDGAAILVCIVLAVGVLIVFAPASGYGQVFYDDDFLGPGNPGVQAGLSAEGLRYAWTTLIGFWHPLTWMSLQLDHELYDGRGPGYHVTNILLHAASTLLLFGWLRRMSNCLWPSALVAGLFAVHPLNVEPVAWIAERRGLVSAFFAMLSLAAYAEYAVKPTVWRYFGVVLAMVCSLMAKATGVVLPGVFLLLDYWPLRRMVGVRTKFLTLLLEKLPLVCISLAFAILTVRAENVAGALTWIEVSWPVRLANALVSYCRYLTKMVWPVDLIPYYPHPGSAALTANWELALGILMMVTAAALWQARRYPYGLTGWLWYLGTLIPVIGLVQVGRHGFAERYAYLSLVGIFIIVAWAATDVARRWQVSGLVVALATIVLAGCAVTSWLQVHYWQNNYTLWRHTLEVTPASALAHNSYGVALMARGENEEAIRHFQAAAEGDANYAMAHYNWAMALAQSGRMDEAIEQFRESLRLNRDYAETHYNLGVALTRVGETREAVGEFEEALKINPADAKSHHNLAVALEKLGNHVEARKHFAEEERLRGK